MDEMVRTIEIAIGNNDARVRTYGLLRKKKLLYDEMAADRASSALVFNFTGSFFYLNALKM